MKITTQKEILESILIHLQPFLEKKDASQITSHIFFTTLNGISIIKATDLEIGLSINTSKIRIEEEGSFTANGKKLLDIIRILKNEELILEIQNDILIIQQNKSKFKLPTFDSKAYPSFPQSENKPTIHLNSSTLIQNLKKISLAIDSNNPKFELNGAFINIKENQTHLVGTDTRRLAIASLENHHHKNLSLIVPKKAILEIQKLFLDEIDIFADETNLMIQNKHFFFYTKLINGKYPDYQRIIPTSTKYRINLPKKEMLDSIKMITTISQEIKLIFTHDSIIFQSLSSDNIEAKTQLEIQIGLKQEFQLAFNSRYLLDFLSQTNNEFFSLELNEPSLPFLVKDENFITIIMPIDI